MADSCMDTAVSVELFVEILNRYVYYFDQQNETVSFPYATPAVVAMLMQDVRSLQSTLMV